MVFEGQVQGVGFRWTALAKAQKIGITGWVRNEFDGTVTMELQGTDEEISQFFGEFNRSYANYPIDYTMVDKEDVALVPTEAEFEVRYAH